MQNLLEYFLRRLVYNIFNAIRVISAGRFAGCGLKMACKKMNAPLKRHQAIISLLKPLFQHPFDPKSVWNSTLTFIRLGDLISSEGLELMKQQNCPESKLVSGEFIL
ncbi:MAG: hypothetical protein AB1757_28725 [Acidobacteriota bacterium]